MLGEALLVVLIAFTPIAEVRGAIPLAYALGLDAYQKGLLVTLAILSNSLIPFLALSVLQFIEDSILNSNRKFLARTYARLVSRARTQGTRYFGRWGYLGLTAFVAIPLPVTGAWTASLIAHIFGLNRLKSSLAIVVGILIASLIVILALEGFITLINII
ncbi:MAG: small multi-drug export protein [Zestosphaera sp.]